jgi:hypothetical protein
MFIVSTAINTKEWRNFYVRPFFKKDECNVKYVCYKS